MPELALDEERRRRPREPSRRHAMWGSWCGLNRRRTPPAGAVLRSSVRAALADQSRPPVGQQLTQEHRSDR